MDGGPALDHSGLRLPVDLFVAFAGTVLVLLLEEEKIAALVAFAAKDYRKKHAASLKRDDGHAFYFFQRLRFGLIFAQAEDVAIRRRLSAQDMAAAVSADILDAGRD